MEKIGQYLNEQECIFWTKFVRFLAKNPNFYERKQKYWYPSKTFVNSSRSGARPSTIRPNREDAHTVVGVRLVLVQPFHLHQNPSKKEPLLLSKPTLHAPSISPPLMIWGGGAGKTQVLGGRCQALCLQELGGSVLPK